MNFRCYHCKQSAATAQDTLLHIKKEHHDDEVAILVAREGGRKYRAVHFCVKAKDLDGNHTIDDETMTIKRILISTASPVSETSHRMPIHRNDTPLAHTQIRCDPKDDIQTNNSANETDDSATEVNKTIDEMYKLIPNVAQELQKANRLSDWLLLMRQLSSGRFPTDNIAFQLFMDVVRFLELDSVHAMRYSDEVKQFWALSYRLFRGKFIRLMGGPKCSGMTDPVDVHPSAAKINFVVPSLPVIRRELCATAYDCESPGILVRNIQNFAKLMCNSNASCKLSFDGKKISMGFGHNLGDVNMFGHEEKPSLYERKERLRVETQILEKLNEVLDALEEAGFAWIRDDANAPQIDNLRELTIAVPRILGQRLKELREFKLKKQLLHDRLLKEVDGGSSWKESKLSYAISAVKTMLYRLNLCIENLLDSIDGIGEVHAAASGKRYLFAKGTTVDLNSQKNYVCLHGYPEGSQYKLDTPLDVLCQSVPQRTDEWFSIRQRAKVTGSTLNNAIGLSTTNKQREHYDFVFSGQPKPEPSPVAKVCMEHGTSNEIHAIGTIAGKILPSIRPDICFFEEGCYIIRNEDDIFLVVSPDGSGRIGSSKKMAIEIKCPIPGKSFTTDVHYSIPRYYVCQILAEMKALGCDKLLYVSFSKESTTVHEAEFDNTLWDQINQHAEQVYGKTTHSRPQRKSSHSKQIASLICEYVRNKVTFLGEFRSCFASKCACTPTTSQPRRSRGSHSARTDLDPLDLTDVRTRFLKAMDALKASHDITRSPAKEVVVFMLSDMDRLKKSNLPHAVPVAYGLSGYSLTMNSMRSVIKAVISECEKNSIDIVAVSSDGQFYNISVRGANGEPLTILQLVRDTWDETKKVAKTDQVKMLMATNKVQNVKTFDDVISKLDININLRGDEYPVIHGPILVSGLKNGGWKRLLTPKQLPRLLRRTTCATAEDSQSADNTCYEDHIMHMLSSDMQESLDELTLGKIRDINRLISESRSNMEITENSNPDQNDTTASPEDIIEDTDTNRENDRMGVSMPSTDESKTQTFYYESTLIALKKNTAESRRNKWLNVNVENFKQMVLTSSSISKGMTKADLIVCLNEMGVSSDRNSKKCLSSLVKIELVNLLCSRIGLPPLNKVRSPQTLQTIMREMLMKRYPKLATNAIYAINVFQQKLHSWRENNKSIFDWKVSVDGMDEPYVFYSFPERSECSGREIAYMLDCHHLFVNIRCLICRKGIPERGLYRDSWLEVAKSGRTNLNVVMVEDVLDPRSNEVSKIVFSVDVEKELQKRNHHKEAEFCRIIRQWYEAEDSAGFSSHERMSRRMDMRNWLLSGTNLSNFPPSGMFVSGVTQVQFEGILTNIDRRLQMYALTKSGTYNVRAPSTLDSENFFSSFQELDPKGQGVLMADDIPHVLGAATYVLNAQVDPQKHFVMETSKRKRVYTAHAVTSANEEPLNQGMTTDTGCKIKHITLRDHQFDDPVCVKRYPRKKNAEVSNLDAPFKGVRGIREYHKKDESKILHTKLLNIDL